MYIFNKSFVSIFIRLQRYKNFAQTTTISSGLSVVMARFYCIYNAKNPDERNFASMEKKEGDSGIPDNRNCL